MNETPQQKKHHDKWWFEHHRARMERESLYADFDGRRFPGEYQVKGHVSSGFVRELVDRHNAEVAWERDEVDNDLEDLINADPELVAWIRELPPQAIKGYLGTTGVVGNTITGTGGRKSGNSVRGNQA